jgi:hypothetical protein
MTALFTPEEQARRAMRWPHREKMLCRAMRREVRVFKQLILRAKGTQPPPQRGLFGLLFCWRRVYEHGSPTPTRPRDEGGLTAVVARPKR